MPKTTQPLFALNAEAFSHAQLDAARSAVRSLAGSPALDAAAKAAFGDDVSGRAVTAVVEGFDKSGWPKLVMLAAKDLNGAHGAYDAAHNTIYLSRDFAATGSPEAVKAVLIEEIGHAIDARVHPGDSAGDEGEIFARYVTGHAPGAEELHALKAQDDHGTIQVGGHAVQVEFAAPVAGSVVLDGNLSEWSAAERIDKALGTPGYEIYGKASGDSYVFALKAPGAIGTNTTAWLNTDQNSGTGFQVFGFAGGAEFNVNFDATGTPHLYTGGAGQTLVSTADVSFGFSADHAVVEFAVQKGALGSPGAINTLWDVNDAVFLPNNYSAPQYEVLDTSNLPQRTDFTKHIGIVYSDTSANAYFSKMAYSQLFMNAQNEAAQAGVRYEVLSENDLTDLSKLVNYDALVFPGFRNVQADKLPAIEHNLKLAVEHYHIGIVTAGEFMTNDQSGAPLAGDPYARMKALLDLQIVGSGFPGDVSVKAADVAHPVMEGYAAGEAIHDYSGVGWLAFAPVDAAGTDVLATQTVGGTTYGSVITTSTGGRNVHFSTDAVMADNNMLSHAIDFAVNGAGVTAGIELSRNDAIVASRTDVDQAMEREDVSPPGGGPGILDKLLPILQDWKAAYNFVGSYYVDIGDKPNQAQATDWAKSGPLYQQLLALGNELGSHSTSHPDNTNLLTSAQIQYEFQGSKQIIEQHMSQILGRPFTLDGAAVPGAPETLPTALQISQYYNYLSGGYAGVGAGYPGAIGYLNPDMAAQGKVYIAPNVTFDFTNVEFKHMTTAQAAAQWQSEWNALTAHSDLPVVIWPWHDYGAAAWSTDAGTTSPYSPAMYTDFIARAYNAGSEFVTLADLADRIADFNHSTLTTSISGNTVNATVNSPDAGRFALDLDHLGSQKIASVTNWYAYDDDSVFLSKGGGSYTITLGTTQADVTHIAALPMRADLLSLSGNGTDLSFSLLGEGKLLIDLADPAGRQVSVSGATISSLAGDKLTLDVGANGQHDVTVRLVAPNHAPVISSNGGGDAATLAVAENATAVTTVAATDSDAGQALAYSIIGGADAASFAIDPATGALRFVSAPNFEAPADADHNNSYLVQVRASDNGIPSLADSQMITVNVTDSNDNAPVITTAATQSVAENTTLVAALTSTDVDTVGVKPSTFSISGGADAAKFGIVNGNLVFLAAPDFEASGDADHNNSYLVQVSAFDGVNTSSRLITTNVTDVADSNRAPVITSNGGGATAVVSVAENGTAVTTVKATDADAGQTLAYSIAGGADAALFGINAQTGVLNFLASPDFEAPRDQGANNVYDVVVSARDSLGASDTQALAVNVTNVAGRNISGNNFLNLISGTGEEDNITGGAGLDLLFGLGGNDTLGGGAGLDILDGGAGNDRLTGAGGNDRLIGGPGNDTLTGGAGNDTFDFNVLGDGVDTVTDFSPGNRNNGDVLDLRDLLVGYRAGTSNVDNFVHLVAAPNGISLQVNADGVGSDFLTVATLQGVDLKAGTLHDWAAQGDLLL